MPLTPMLYPSTGRMIRRQIKDLLVLDQEPTEPMPPLGSCAAASGIMISQVTPCVSECVPTIMICTLSSQHGTLLGLDVPYASHAITARL
jgi:hypothetical protein